MHALENGYAAALTPDERSLFDYVFATEFAVDWESCRLSLLAMA
jgi:hypothetical protein